MLSGLLHFMFPKMWVASSRRIRLLVNPTEIIHFELNGHIDDAKPVPCGSWWQIVARLGVESREVTIMFCDVVSQMNPPAAFAAQIWTGSSLVFF
jgi:hypothetical protein